ncbi:hypothetical protein Tco_0509741 [Tanacetum coccineum]
MEATGNEAEAKFQQKRRLHEPTKIRTKTRQVHTAHKISKENLSFGKRKIQGSATNDNVSGKKQTITGFVNSMGSGKDQPKAAKKGEAFGKDIALAILMVQPWQRVARQRITQSFSLDPEISFPPLRDEDGTEGPMIIEAEIGGHFIHRIYVDGGSTLEILYEHCFNRLRPEVKNQIVPASIPLIDELCGSKITIFIQRDRRKTMGKENSSSLINYSRNVKIPSSMRNTYSMEQQDNPTRMGLQNESTAFRRHDKGSATLCGAFPECPRGMLSNQIKEKKPSTREKQGNTRRSGKNCGSWHHEGSSLPQLVVKPGNGKKA